MTALKADEYKIEKSNHAGDFKYGNTSLIATFVKSVLHFRALMSTVPVSKIINERITRILKIIH